MNGASRCVLPGASVGFLGRLLDTPLLPDARTQIHAALHALRLRESPTRRPRTRTGSIGSPEGGSSDRVPILPLVRGRRQPTMQPHHRLAGCLDPIS